VAIVNARFAARFFNGEDPIGRRIRFPDDDPADETGWLTIVGVSADIRHGNPRDREVPAVAYVPIRQMGPTSAAAIVRSRADPAALVAAVRREVQALDPDQAVGTAQTVDQILVRQSWPFRVFGTAFAILALIALTLASVGLYAVIAYSVSTRTQEIGVRMALGASGGRVRWLILRRGLVQIGLGLAIGLAGAYAVGRWVLSIVLAQVSGTDPLIFAAVPALLALVALAACLIPARRAAGLDPLVALRNE
jgi:putative ABC transport system permease protein